MTAENPSQRFKVGLTGGIASGKTTVANIFADLGAAVIDTDLIARDVVQQGSPALAEIQQQFGKAVITENGELDRAAMRQLIFSDERHRAALEEILHPRIGAETRRQSDTAVGDYQVIVVPLLVSSPLRRFVDRVLVVDCDEETQIDRLLARDAETREQALRIIAAQASREERLAIADDVIVNNKALSILQQDVLKLHQKYLSLAGH